MNLNVLKNNLKTLKKHIKKCKMETMFLNSLIIKWLFVLENLFSVNRQGEGRNAKSYIFLVSSNE